MFEKFRSLFVDDIKEVHKWLSTWIAVLLIGLSSVDQYLPAVQQYLPPGWTKWIGIAFIVARVIRQGKKDV